MAAAGELTDAQDLEEAVRAVLGGWATADGPALAAAHRAEALEPLRTTDTLLAATKLPRESRAASAAMGRRLLASVSALGVRTPLLDAYTAAVLDEDAPGQLAVARGAALRALGVPLSEALLSSAHGTAAALVTAGQRLIPLGQSAAQRVLFDLGGAVRRAAGGAAEAPADDLFAFAPLLEVHAMRHERQDGRLYIS